MPACAPAPPRRSPNCATPRRSTRSSPPSGTADVNVRRHVVRALGEIGDARALPALTAALKDEDADVRRRAVAAIAEISDGPGDNHWQRPASNPQSQPEPESESEPQSEPEPASDRSGDLAPAAPDRATRSWAVTDLASATSPWRLRSRRTSAALSAQSRPVSELVAALRGGRARDPCPRRVRAASSKATAPPMRSRRSPGC